MMVVTLGQQYDAGEKPTVTLYTYIVFKKNLNASKPSEHPPSGEKMCKGLVRWERIGCRDKTSSWYQTGSPM